MNEIRSGKLSSALRIPSAKADTFDADSYLDAAAGGDPGPAHGPQGRRPGAGLSRLLLGCLAATAVLRCTDADATRLAAPLNIFAAPRLIVESVQTYGYASISDASAELTALEREYEAGVLGSVADVAEGPDSMVYIADRDFQKIAVFSRNGAFDRLILGGYGEGPGEFIRLRSISVSRDGRLAALDEGLNRISIFAPDDELETTFGVGAITPLQIAFVGDTILVLDWFKTGEPAIHMFSAQGDSLGTLVDASTRAAHFSEFGSPGALAQGAGTALYASPMPGEWRTIRGRAVEQHGQEIFPTARGLTLHDDRGALRRLPVSTRGIGVSHDGTILLAFTHHPDPTDIEARRFDLYVAQFTADLELASLADVSTSLGAVMCREVSRFGNELYVSATAPFPHVKRVRLSEATREVRS